MVKLGKVALDGTKVRANASKHKAMSYARLTEKQKVLAQEISELVAEAKTVDADEDARFGPGKRGDELPVEVANRQDQAAVMAAARASLEEEAKAKARTGSEEKATKRGDDDDDITAAGNKTAQDAVPKPTAHRNFTDPDSRIMKRADGSFSYNYNGQAVVDGHRQVVVAAELNQASNVYGQLVPMVEKTFQIVGQVPRQWLADTAYCSKANLDHARGLEVEHGTEFFISTGRMKHSAPVPESPRGWIPANITVVGADGTEVENEGLEEGLRQAQGDRGTGLRTDPHPARQAFAVPRTGKGHP